MRSLEKLFFFELSKMSVKKITRMFILFRLYDTKEVLFLRWKKRHLSAYVRMLMTQLEI